MVNPVLARIGNWFVGIGRALSGQILSSGSRVFAISSPEVYATIDEQGAISKGFDDNISVYSIVMKDAKKFGSIPIYVYDAKKKEEKALPAIVPNIIRKVREIKAYEVAATKPAQLLTTLLNRPNPYESQDSFFTRVRAYYKVCGEAFIWLNRGDLEGYRLADGSFDDMAIDRLPVLEMQVLPSNLITIIPDPTDLWGILGYILEVGERVHIRKGDVIHWKNVNLDFEASTRTHLRGMTTLRPGSKTLEESNSLSRNSMRSAQNDGAKAIIFEKSLKPMSPTTQTDIKSVIDAKVNNATVSNSVATVQGDWGLINLAITAKDQMTLEKKAATWQEFCFLLDVPYEFFSTDTTFANKEQALLGWVTNDLIPACKQFNGELNRVLLKAFKVEGSLLIAADYSELPEIQKGMVDAAKVLQDIWSIAPDDVREMLGFEPIGGEFAEPWVPSGRTPISMMNMNDGMAPEDAIIAAYGNPGTGNA